MSTDYKLVCYTCKSEMPLSFASSSIFYGYKVLDLNEQARQWLGNGLPIGLHEGYDLRIVIEHKVPWYDDEDEDTD